MPCGCGVCQVISEPVHQHWPWYVRLHAWSMLRVRSPHRRQTCGQGKGTCQSSWRQCPGSNLSAEAHWSRGRTVRQHGSVTAGICFGGTANPPEVVCSVVVDLVRGERQCAVGLGRGVAVASQNRSHLVRAVDRDTILLFVRVFVFPCVCVCVVLACMCMCRCMRMCVGACACVCVCGWV